MTLISKNFFSTAFAPWRNTIKLTNYWEKSTTKNDHYAKNYFHYLFYIHHSHFAGSEDISVLLTIICEAFEVYATKGIPAS